MTKTRRQKWIDLNACDVFREYGNPMALDAISPDEWPFIEMRLLNMLRYAIKHRGLELPADIVDADQPADARRLEPRIFGDEDDVEIDLLDADAGEIER